MLLVFLGYDYDQPEGVSALHTGFDLPDRPNMLPARQPGGALLRLLPD